MRSFLHLVAYQTARLSSKTLFGLVTSVQVVGDKRRPRKGPFILAANHISHFDPPLIAAVIRQKIDWMAMAEFFPHPILGRILRAIDCLPTDRHRAERRTIRDAIKRLKANRILGMFPEGGIRDGAASLLEGATLKPGVSALAHIAGAPIVPCIILGSDRLYAKHSWRPFRRTPIWIGYGDPIPVSESSGDREVTEQKLAAAFENLYNEMRQEFSLSADDLPHSPRSRMTT